MPSLNRLEYHVNEDTKVHLDDEGVHSVQIEEVEFENDCSIENWMTVVVQMQIT